MIQIAGSSVDFHDPTPVAPGATKARNDVNVKGLPGLCDVEVGNWKLGKVLFLKLRADPSR